MNDHTSRMDKIELVRARFENFRAEQRDAEREHGYSRHHSETRESGRDSTVREEQRQHLHRRPRLSR